MPGQWEAPRWWGTNIYRTIAWLKAPSDEEDYASFQLAPDPSDGVECLPEVYALETSNPIFTLIWYRLRKAFASRRRVLTLTSWPNSDVVITRRTAKSWFAPSSPADLGKTSHGCVRPSSVRKIARSSR